jgi:hypothetical protein
MTRATSRTSKAAGRFWLLVAVKYVEMNSPPGLLGRCSNQNADRLRSLAVFANDLAYIVLGHPQFHERMRSVLDFPNLYRVRIIDESSGNRSYEIFH